MELLAAIDLVDGGAVRLVQGDFGRQTDYGDPLDVARRYVAGGATWLHLVDLDAARTGRPHNRPLVAELAAEARAHGVRVEAGGGVRTADDVRELLAAGVDRVVLGTAALEDPSFALDCARRHPGSVAVGLDYRRTADGALVAAARGWLTSSGRTVEELLGDFAPAPPAAVVVTAIERDGTLSGPDLDGLAVVLDATEVPVVASGGVASADDLRALTALRSPGAGRGLAGVVVGKALLDGRIGLEEAIAACEPSG
jgi:phosphoribosylformimino-5-aminoimidazole carboxamide ribotide isomerase